MHELSYFREHLDFFADMAKQRNMSLDLDGFRALDRERRELITANEQRKSQRNKASDEIARLKKEKKSADALIAEMKQVSETIKQTDVRVDELDARQRELLLTIPNIPHSSVPTGKGAEDNVEMRRWGTPPKFDFQPKPHWEVGERAGILDLEAAARITGARFAVYKGWGARLERALANFMQQVIDLAFHRAYLDGRIHQSRRPDDLLNDDARRLGQLVGSGSSRDTHGLIHPMLEFLEGQGAVVESRRQTEAILY